MSHKNTTVAEKQILATMSANGQSITSMRKETGLHNTTIQKVLAEPKTQEMIETAGKLLSGKMLERADQIVNSISDEDVFKASLRDKTVSAGVLMDKARQAYGLDKQAAVINFGDFSIGALFQNIQPQGNLLDCQSIDADPE